MPCGNMLSELRFCRFATRVSSLTCAWHTVWPLVSKHICFSGLTISSLEHGFIQVMRKHLEQKYLCLVEQAKRGEPHTMRGSVALGYLAWKRGGRFDLAPYMVEDIVSQDAVPVKVSSHPKSVSTRSKELTE